MITFVNEEGQIKQVLILKFKVSGQVQMGNKNPIII